MKFENDGVVLPSPALVGYRKLRLGPGPGGTVLLKMMFGDFTLVVQPPYRHCTVATFEKLDVAEFPYTVTPP